MQQRIAPFALLALLLCGGACTPVRTIYDEQGNVVTNDAPGGEKDLVSAYEKKFNESFSVTKTKDGVPQTTSSKVSRFQKELDNARKTDTTFSTGSFDTGKRLDLRSQGADGLSKRFYSGKDDIEKPVNSMYSTDLRPDFMNETKGLGLDRRYMTPSNSRSHMEGIVSHDSGTSHNLDDTVPYQTSESSTYVETRRNKRGEPTIIPFREYQKQQIFKLRDLLGRDNDPQ